MDWSQLHRYLVSLGCCAAFLLSACGDPADSSNVIPTFKRLELVDKYDRPWGKAIGDINGDAVVDLLVAYQKSGVLVAYLGPDYQARIIAEGERFGTDLAIADIDADGGPDIVAITRDAVVFYRGPDWSAQVVAKQALHDIEAVDIDGDGLLDLVGRDQSAFKGSGSKIFFYYQQPGGRWKSASLKVPEGEGLAVADLNDDARPDVLVAGYWYQNLPDADTSLPEWREHRYGKDWDWPHVVIAVADLNQDERLDVVLTPAELKGQRYRVSWFAGQADHNGAWPEYVVEDDVEAVMHSLAVADMDLDGRVDVITAEMHQGQDPDALSVYLNRGPELHWEKMVIDQEGSHGLKTADLDADGDMDLFGANHKGEHQTPRIWFNESCPSAPQAWRRWLIDGDRPGRAVLMGAEDLNGDGLTDIVTGAFWYRNPGRLSTSWPRIAVAQGFANFALAADFNGDGLLDLAGSSGHELKSAENLVIGFGNGAGEFSLTEAATVSGDFLQGASLINAGPAGSGPGIALSFHKAGEGVQFLQPADDPRSPDWRHEVISEKSQDEALTTADLDGDGRKDLLLGTRWLRNTEQAWEERVLHRTEALPDRNLVADINGDGNQDVVIGYQAVSQLGTVAWYERGAVATDAWIEHPVAEVTGPMSVGVGDLDLDGDQDLVVGEHDRQRPENAAIYWFENADGKGLAWQQHLIYRGDEHHDGAVVRDVDADGDLDVLSIGWDHHRVLLYENRMPRCSSDGAG